VAEGTLAAERKQFFFEKKNQKTFMSLAYVAAENRDSAIKVFCFFSSEKKTFLQAQDTNMTVTRARLLRQPGLLPMILGRSFSSLAAQMQAVAVGWQIYALTGSAFSLGLVGLAQFLPVVALVLVAGHIVDRSDRRRVAALCQAIAGTAALALAVAAFTHHLTPAMIYALIVVVGAAKAFEAPSLQALLPALVPGELFPSAAALSASVFQTATIVGPSLGGLLYGLGSGIVYAICACIFFAAALSTYQVPAIIRKAALEPPSLASFFGGLTFIRQRPEILGAISLDLFAVLLGGATALLPIYAHDILKAGPAGLGLLRAAPGLGAIVVSVWLTRHPMRGVLGLKMFTAVGVFGIATILFGLSRSLPLSVVMLAALGGADVVSVVIRSSLVQMRTPDAMRGRVAAVNMLFIGSSNQLGEFESGTLAALVGAIPAVVVGGVGTLVVAGLWMALFPALRRLDTIKIAAEPAS
jgi:MFS family permease